MHMFSGHAYETFQAMHSNVSVTCLRAQLLVHMFQGVTETSGGGCAAINCLSYLFVGDKLNDSGQSPIFVC